jgi:histone acetyltransferase (RNA polymerase elongator complex component)
MKKLTVPFFISHRGCPHRCVFCDQVKISGSAEVLPRESDLIGKIGEYGKTSNGRKLEVAFFGGSFTSLPAAVQEKLLAPLQPLLSSGEIASVRISTRPDSVDSASAVFLKTMGVGVVELGVQSMDDYVLELSGRGHGTNAVADAVSLLKDQGLAAGIQLMPGLPGDTPAKSLDSLERVLALKPDFLRIYPTLVIAGTPLEDLYVRGTYLPMTLDGAVQLCKVMLVESLRSNVPVIRMGLQPTADLMTEGVIVAGPWHPAFRQMVEAELCFDLINVMIHGAVPWDDKVTVFCCPSRVSDVAGQRRANAERLWRQLGIRITAVRPDPELSPVELRVVSDGGVRRGNMLRDLRYCREVVENV